MPIQNARVGSKVHSVSEVEVGTVLLLRGKNRQPFIVQEVTKHSETHSEITHRLDILECGHTVPSHRKVSLSSLESSYLWVADRFMSPDYIQFCASVEGKFNPNRELDKLWKLFNDLLKVNLGKAFVREHLKRHPELSPSTRFDFRGVHDVWGELVDELNETLQGITSQVIKVPDFGTLKSVGSVMRPKFARDDQIQGHVLTEDEIAAMSPEEHRHMELLAKLNDLIGGPSTEFVDEDTGKVINPHPRKGPGLPAATFKKIMTEAGFVQLEVDSDGKLKIPPKEVQPQPESDL